MTLHSIAEIDRFARHMAGLWAGWSTRYGHVVRRRLQLVGALRTAADSAGIARPRVEIVEQHHVSGSFDRKHWRIRLVDTVLPEADPYYGAFVRTCMSAYHELRHAEQHVRCAQALSVGALDFPGRDHHTVINRLPNLDHLSLQRRMDARIAMWDRVARHERLELSPSIIARLLGIPQWVTEAAVVDADARFAAFENAPRPPWFRRRTIRAEVGEWMRNRRKPGLKAIYSMAKHHRLRGIYEDQPIERDTYGLHALVGERIAAAIGVPLQPYDPRTRSDQAFRRLT